MQSIDECKRKDLFTTVRYFGELDLKEVDVGFEVVSLPYLNGDEVMSILLGLLARGVLGKKCFSHLRKVMERVWRQGLEPIRGRTFRLEEKSENHDWVIARVDHHRIPVVPDVLNQIVHSTIVVESWS